MTRILKRADWGFAGPLGPAMSLPARGAWLHHSVTAPTGSPEVDFRTIERIGRNRFGRLSYSWLVHPSGVIGQGQDRHVGAHTAGHNSTTEAICLVGNYETTVPPAAMLEAVAWLVRRQHDAGVWTSAKLLGGHRDAPGAATACPGRHAHAAIPTINRLAQEDDMSGHQHPHPHPDRFQHDGFRAPFRRMKRLNIFTRHTKPADIVETGQLGVYLGAVIDAIAEASGVDVAKIEAAVEASVRKAIIDDLND